MDALTLALWTRETAPRLTGARILDGGSTAPWHFGLALEERRLTIVLDRSHPTVFEDPGGPQRFRGGLPGTISEPLFGARIQRVEAAPGERMLDVFTDRGRLIVEFYAACPLLAWLTPAGDVAAVHANGRLDTVRIRIGAPYRTPEAPPGVRFAGADRRSVTALDPGGTSDWEALLTAAEARVAPRVVLRGHVFAARAFPTQEETAAAETDTINEALRVAYTLHRRNTRVQSEAARLRQDVRQLSRRIRRSLEAVERDLASARAWPTWQKFGSALLASPHVAKRGMTEADVPDVFDGAGTTLRIPLDPKLNAMENAAGYLKKAKRGERAIPIVEKRREELRADEAWLAARSEDPTEWDEASREALEALLVRHRIRRAAPRGPSAKPRATAGGGFHPRRYRSSDGWTILVGRSNAENDWLSLKHAKPDDVWLHAQGVSGAHVVLRRDGRKDNPSARTLEEAAGLAATFSRARHAATVPVVHTLAKYVRKPRKAPPGTVTCTREKTILVAPIDPKALSHADDDTDD